METHCEVQVQPNGARVEVATIVHEGKSFTNLGSVVDEERGRIVAYVRSVVDPAYRSGHRYELTTWNGESLGPLTLVSSWEQWTPRAHMKTRFFAWRFVAKDGRVYHGRNAGPGMIVRLRGKGK